MGDGEDGGREQGVCLGVEVVVRGGRLRRRCLRRGDVVVEKGFWKGRRGGVDDGVGDGGQWGVQTERVGREHLQAGGGGGEDEVAEAIGEGPVRGRADGGGGEVDLRVGERERGGEGRGEEDGSGGGEEVGEEEGGEGGLVQEWRAGEGREGERGWHLPCGGGGGSDWCWGGVLMVC